MGQGDKLLEIVDDCSIVVEKEINQAKDFLHF